MWTQDPTDTRCHKINQNTGQWCEVAQDFRNQRQKYRTFHRTFTPSINSHSIVRRPEYSSGPFLEGLERFWNWKVRAISCVLEEHYRYTVSNWKVWQVREYVCKETFWRMLG